MIFVIINCIIFVKNAKWKFETKITKWKIVRNVWWVDGSGSVQKHHKWSCWQNATCLDPFWPIVTEIFGNLWDFWGVKRSKNWPKIQKIEKIFFCPKMMSKWLEVVGKWYFIIFSGFWPRQMGFLWIFWISGFWG